MAVILKNAPPASTADQKLAEDKIITARVQLLMTQPFWGQMCSRLELKDATQWCPTAATDGRYFYYNAHFIKKMTKPEIMFVVAHEIEHCIYDHFSRKGSRDPRLWNCAGDFVINLELKECGVGQFPKGLELLYDPKFKDMTAEEVYEIIKKDPKFQNGGQDSFDVHLDENTDGDSNGDKDGDGDGNQPPKDGMGPVKMSKEEKEKLKEDMKNAVIKAAKGQQAGSIPGNIARMVQELTDPKMDWREILQMQIQSCLKDDFTWQRPNRKSFSSGIYLPAMKNQETIDVCIAIDTSGSMSDEMIKDLISEVYGIMNQYSDFLVRIWTFDHVVYEQSYAEFRSDNIDDILTWEPHGGGGTSFNANWKFMKDKDIVPNKLIFMTDGYTGDGWGDPDYCDTVFLIHSNPQRNMVAPHGITLYYEDAE